MKIIINGAFKTGTSTIKETLKNNNIETTKIHCSNFENNHIYLTTIRNQKEIYLSSFFQDIHIPKYDYCLFHNDENIQLYDKMKKNKENPDKFFREKYLKIEKNENFINELLNKFLNVDWTKYNYLQNKTHLHNLNIIDENVQKIPFKKNGYFIYENKDKNIKIVFIDYKIIDNVDILNEILNNLGIDIKLDKIHNSNIGTKKFYRNEYIKLIELLKSKNYFDENYYDFLNENIYQIL